MSIDFYLFHAQLERIRLYFTLSHGALLVDDRRDISETISVIKHALQWKDAPREYMPYKTLKSSHNQKTSSFKKIPDF